MAQVEEWRTRVVHKVKITRSDGYVVECGKEISGSDYLKLTTPEGTKPHALCLCTVHNYPVSGISIILYSCKSASGEIVMPHG